MHRFSAKLGVWNSRKAPQVVAVEPWGNDYTLLPGEKLEVVAFGESAMPWFNVVEWDGATQVYCEDMVDFKVVQGDRELECGHQRQAEPAAAPEYHPRNGFSVQKRPTET
jgi:hypothetical protein